MDFMDFDRKKLKSRNLRQNGEKSSGKKSIRLKTFVDLRLFVFGQPEGGFLEDLLV